MLLMAVAHTDELDGVRAGEELVAGCQRDLAGHLPQAGLLLASHDLDAEPLLDAIHTAFPGIELIGTTTLAPMSSVGGYAEGETTLTVFASDVVDFTTGLGSGVASGLDGASRAAVAEALAGTEKLPALAIVLPSVESYDAAAVCDEVGGALGADVPVVGGGSVPDYPVLSPWLGGRQFRGRTVHTDSLPLLLLSGPLRVSVGVRHGWTPVGRPAVVTRAKAETVHEIDNAPITEYFHHYGLDDAGGPATPLAMLDEETGRHYLRAPLDWDEEEGSVRFHGSVPEGATVQLAMATTDQILDGTRQSVEDAVAAYPTGGSGPEAALAFSCAVRSLLLGSQVEAEVRLLTEALGRDLPLSGFYAYGEFSPLGPAGVTRMHNETCVTVLLGT